jgi:choline dehydrogenase-like flavoprotein
MRVESLETICSNETIFADICLIGSGPASLAIATELKNEKIRLLIVESGGLETQAHSDALSEIETVGMPRVMDQTKVRNRVFGGSSQTWKGKCATLDPIDFESRHWVPLSGWPIKLDQLSPFMSRACSFLGIHPHCQGVGIWRQLGRPRPEPDLDGQTLSPFFWQYSRDEKNPLDYMRFGPRFLKLEQDNCRVLYNATVTHIDTNQDCTVVQGVEIADQADRRLKVMSPLIVLCAGGIENPRILLASRRVVPAGVGNERDLVGRYLMDHPRCTVAHFDLKKSKNLSELRDRYGAYRFQKTAGAIVQGVALGEKVQREEELLNCAAWLTEIRSSDDPWDRLKLFLMPGPEGRHIKDLLCALSQPGTLVKGCRRRIFEGRGLLHHLDGLVFDAMVEQTPDANSRLSLADRRDRFGVPIPRIDWRIGDKERRSIARLASLMVEEFPRLGLPAPHLVRWVNERDYQAAEFYDPAHPSGTTRMAESPTQGVVDTECQVHGVSGLYIAGGSVFPTNGHANPTMMIVLLAIRLAEHLRHQFRKSTDACLSTGFRTLSEAEIDFDRHVEGSSAVVHLGVEKSNIHTMPRVNVDATRALAEGADRAGTRYE